MWDDIVFIGFVEFIEFAEIQSHFYVALDQNYVTQETFEQIYYQAEKVSKLDSGFIKYLNTQLNKPNKLNRPNKPYPLEKQNFL